MPEVTSIPQPKTAFGAIFWISAVLLILSITVDVKILTNSKLFWTSIFGLVISIIRYIVADYKEYEFESKLGTDILKANIVKEYIDIQTSLVIVYLIGVPLIWIFA